MRRISVFRDRFEVELSEKITVTVEAKKTPLDVTFSNDPASPVFTPEPAPPLVDKRSFTMGGADNSFTITYRFPPFGQRDPNAQYEVTFHGKNGTSDGPITIFSLPALDSIIPLYEFRAAVVSAGGNVAVAMSEDD